MCLLEPTLAAQDLDRARKIESEAQGKRSSKIEQLRYEIFLACKDLQQAPNNLNEIFTAFGRKNVAAMRQHVTQETERK
jgi:hypothetical protein